ncbi:MAG: succinate dehydrogenase, cytochrome b556 subunit [Deltaproteobacteria bacterium]|nr:succinate dehydrogenase, cytochrome b556 subunit [Deltaproteobacteria bacterium]
MKSYQVKSHYRWHPGFMMWLLHRASGLALAAYLVLHVWVLSHLTQGEAEFTRIMDAFTNPAFRLMEIGLLGVFLFHGINGLRVFFMDYGPMAGKEVYVKFLLGTFVLIVLVFLAGGLGMLKTILAE